MAQRILNDVVEQPRTRSRLSRKPGSPFKFFPGKSARRIGNFLCFLSVLGMFATMIIGWRRSPVHEPGLIEIQTMTRTPEKHASLSLPVQEEEKIHKCTRKPKKNWPMPPSPSNGYLMVRSNGGLNQMRAAICDMVAVARHLNATMVIPELDKTSFWADSSDFGDVFDVGHFIGFLKDEVHVIRKLPHKFSHLRMADIFTMDPVSWSNVKYYERVVLPLLKKHKVVRLYHTDARLANNPPAVPKALQRLRCRVQFHALRFAKPLRRIGSKLIRRLQRRHLAHSHAFTASYVAVHLRYEMDMLAFTGCSHGCSKQEEAKLTRLRRRTARWREKDIDSSARRRKGQCPLTPEEAAVLLRALGFSNATQVYVASGKIFGGKRRLGRLLTVFPNTVRKEMLLTKSELAFVSKHSSQLAALDYMVATEADVFMSTFQGNMASLVEGHRRYLGHKKTILPDRQHLVELFELYENGTLPWDKLRRKVMKSHANRIGAPQLRKEVMGKPKEEDYFFRNPQECMCLSGERQGIKFRRKRRKTGSREIS